MDETHVLSFSDPPALNYFCDTQLLVDVDIWLILSESEMSRWDVMAPGMGGSGRLPVSSYNTTTYDSSKYAKSSAGGGIPTTHPIHSIH